MADIGSNGDLRYAERKRANEKSMKTSLRTPVHDSVATDAGGDVIAHRRDPLAALAQRVDRAHIERRLVLEQHHERHVQRFGKRFFYIESWCSAHAVIRASLRLVGLYGRARRNAHALELRENEVRLPNLPPALAGFTILQISDPHVDLSSEITETLIKRVRGIKYDICVLTGDYRTDTFGPHEPTLDAMGRVRPHLSAPVYAVLGNHDSIRMVPGLEALDIRVLLNESVAIRHRGAELHVAGIDDAHHYQLHDLKKARTGIPPDAPSILLSHTPEAYRYAAEAGFDLMLSGHTHGGQICLPGGYPLIIDAECPRRFAKGAWKFERMIGYTSVGSGSSIVDVRLNCPPEVTLHRLRPE
jgi:predicted MPP superfamily phosphohydrolase